MDSQIPKPASTVVICKITTDWPHKILLLQRSKSLLFLPGAHVFPGGRVDSVDRDFAEIIVKDRRNLERIASFFPDGFSRLAVHLAAAIRETLEETGISILGDSFLGNARFIPQLDNWWPISWWVTPEQEVRRYDTVFFLATIDDRCAASLSIKKQEAALGLWVYPKEALRLHEDGALFLPPPTRSILERLALSQNLQHFLTFVDRPLWPIHPALATDENNNKILVLPGDPLHDDPRISSMPPKTRYGFPR